ncbi:hypothetical protein D3C81_1494440 [compost metagenome]
MILSTLLKSSSFMAQVVKGCDQAMDNAYQAAKDIGTAVVLNDSGRAAMLAVYRSGRAMEFLDASDNDVTAIVLSALREYHGYKVFH